MSAPAVPVANDVERRAVGHDPGHVADDFDRHAVGRDPGRAAGANSPRVPLDVVIIANGGANIASLQFALERLRVDSCVSSDAARIRTATHVVLPGVGAAANAMTRLRRDGLHELLPTLHQPVLGICLGMQLLFERSDEGQTECLGIIPGRAGRFLEAPDRPVPHIGWNTLNVERDSVLVEGLAPNDYAYFVHSYALPLSKATVASTCYGAPFSACIEWRNFYGAQFHPERSAAVGARILRNFLAIRTPHSEPARTATL